MIVQIDRTALSFLRLLLFFFALLLFSVTDFLRLIWKVGHVRIKLVGLLHRRVLLILLFFFI